MVAEKLAQFLYAIKLHQILTNFQFFHRQNQEKMCNYIVTKDPQVIRYTTL